MLKKFIFVFLLSMVPVVELRGSILVAGGMHLPKLLSFIICIIGNMLPVPFIYLFARKVLYYGKDKPFIGKLFSFFLSKGEDVGDLLLTRAGRGVFVGLFLFVGIPIPGTGAWTGTLAASLLKFDFKKTIAAVMCGVLCAGVIMMLISYGIFDIIF